MVYPHMAPLCIYEVKVSWELDPYAERAIGWCYRKKLKLDRDWDFDMKGGLQDHSSFWFRDKDTALMFKLACGGM